MASTLLMQVAMQRRVRRDIAMDFIFPEPVSVQKPISWNTAAVKLAALPENQLQALFEQYLRHADTHHVDMRVRVGVFSIVKRNDPIEKIKMAMLGAAASGAIQTYVKSRRNPAYHEIFSQIWRSPVPIFYDPVAMALSGKCLAYREMLPLVSLHSELAGANLLLSNRDFAKLQMIKASSRAARVAYARKIIDVSTTDPATKILRDDFIEQLRKQFPGTSDRELKRVWEDVAPAELHKGGRRPGRR